MSRKNITKFIGYGILIFVIGFIVGLAWFKFLQLLMPVGSIMTFIGVFYFFKETNLGIEFTKNPRDDFMTYFWDVIVLKFWTSTFVIWMIVMDLTLLFSGFIG